MAVTLGTISLDQAIEMFGSSISRRALAQAMNEAGRGAQAVQARAMARYYNINVASARKTQLLRRATAKTLTLAIVSVAQKLPLIDFKPKQTASGLVVEIKRGESYQIPHAFIMTVRGKKKIAARRVPGSQSPNAPLIRRGPRKGSPIRREKTRQLYGTAISNFADNPEVVDEMVEYLAREMPDTFERKLVRILEREISKVGSDR